MRRCVVFRLFLLVSAEEKSGEGKSAPHRIFTPPSPFETLVNKSITLLFQFIDMPQAAFFLLSFKAMTSVEYSNLAAHHHSIPSLILASKPHSS